MIFGKSDLIGTMIVASSSMADVVHRARLFAPYDRPVLVSGDTGTGKEELVRLIHELSGRKGALVAVNSASISDNLIGSELFGHKKGSFSGAVTDKVGLLEAANGGTIFFDEIAEMSLALQASLLRVLQNNELHIFRRVGDIQERNSNCRVICASNRPLEDLIREKKFLNDLFYRLQFFRLEIPPLRKRREDIVALTQYRLTKTCSEFGKQPLKISREVWRVLIGHTWPGNIRELFTVIDRAVAMCGNDIAELQLKHFDFSKEITDRSLSESELEKLLASNSSPYLLQSKINGRRTHEEILAQKDAFLKALNENNWSRSEAAAALGIELSVFFRDIKSMGLEAPDGQWSYRQK